MKKIIIILIILAILGGGGYYYYQNIYLPAQKPTLEVEKNSAQISKYYIYGTHLNLEGEIKKINANFEDLDLVMWNTKTGKTKKFKINYKKNVNNVNFNISDEINNGIYLDNIAKGNYRLYLRFKYEESKKDSDKKETTYKVESVTKEIYTSKNKIGLNLGTEIEFINTSGWLVKRYISNQEITKVTMTDSIAGIVFRDRIEIVNL